MLMAFCSIRLLVLNFLNDKILVLKMLDVFETPAYLFKQCHRNFYICFIMQV